MPPISEVPPYLDSEPFGGTDLKPESSRNTQALNIAEDQHFLRKKTHCLAQRLSGKFLHIRRWFRGGFLQRTSMQRTSLHSSVHICPLPPSQPAAFPSDLLRPSPNYRGTSGLPVSLIFRNLF